MYCTRINYCTVHDVDIQFFLSKVHNLNKPSHVQTAMLLVGVQLGQCLIERDSSHETSNKGATLRSDRIALTKIDRELCICIDN